MALVTNRKCDIYGGMKDVQRIRVITDILDEADKVIGQLRGPIVKDLGLRGRNRLGSMLDKGTTKPNAGNGD